MSNSRKPNGVNTDKWIFACLHEALDNIDMGEIHQTKAPIVFDEESPNYDQVLVGIDGRNDGGNLSYAIASCHPVANLLLDAVYSAVGNAGDDDKATDILIGLLRKLEIKIPDSVLFTLNKEGLEYYRRHEDVIEHPERIDDAMAHADRKLSIETR